MKGLHAWPALLPLLASPLLAESFPVPTKDPHASSWGERGSFTLYYFGELEDGTACPPSPNALQFAITGSSMGKLYLHGYGVDQQAEQFQERFRKGTFCSVAFDGEVRFLMHHGTQARLRPTDVSPPEETPDSTEE